MPNTNEAETYLVKAIPRQADPEVSSRKAVASFWTAFYGYPPGCVTGSEDKKYKE
jgi:hypothetical protein